MIADYMMTQTETPSNPFPGLRPFEFQESLLYFGRDGQSEQLLRKLVSTRFMAVVGTSGSGKSSLVRAGLLPALFGGFMTSADSDWRIAILRPSNDPIGNLARAIDESGLFGSPGGGTAPVQATMIESTLRRGSLGLVEAVRLAQIGLHEHLLVVVDQFEELFRFAQVAASERYQNEAAAFVKLLLEAARQRDVPIYVVLTMRSDFLGDCSLFWDLPEAINEGQYLIPRLTRDQRREAITGPAAVCGAGIAPRLVNRLLNDMGDNPDQLPILQHALMRTWNRWKEENQDREPIDLQHYEAIGEMSAALSRHADEAYNDLKGERSGAIAEKIFKGLTEKGSDNREIRRPIELKELCALAEASEAEVIAVIEVFRREDRSFLMPPAGTPLNVDSLVDISHESLIRNWERLKAWVDEEARSARIYRRLAETSVLHEKGEAGLYRDPDLQLALDWRDGSKPNKTWARRYYPEFEAAMNFLDESREARDKEARDREAQRRKEIKRTRLTALIFALAFLLSLGALVFANSKRVEANESKQQLEAALVEANEQRDRADKERNNAEKAADTAYQNSVAAGLAEEQAGYQARIAKDNEEKAESAAAEAGREKKRAEEGEARARAEGERSRKLLYAANINLAQEAYYDENVQHARELLEDPSTNQEDLRSFEWGYLNWLYHREAGTLDCGDGIVRDVVFSPDGKYLATAGDHAVKLWDASTMQELRTLPTGGVPVNVLAVSPDGSILACSGDSRVMLHKLTSTEAPAVLPGDGLRITSLVFSRDGKTLFTGSAREISNEGRVVAWNLATSKKRMEIAGVTGSVIDLALSPDEKTLATVGWDGTLRLFDVDSGRLSLDSPGGGESVRFSPDGKTIILGTNIGNSFIVFDTKMKDPLAAVGFADALAAPEFSPTVMAFAPQGNKFAIGGHNTLRLYKAPRPGERESPELIAPLLGQEGWITSLTFSPDGEKLAANDAGKVRLWNTRNPRDSVAVESGDRGIKTPFILPDSKSVLMLARYDTGRFITDGTRETAQVRMWDAESRQELKLSAEFAQPYPTVGNSPGGRFVAILSSASTIKLWQTQPLKLTATFNVNPPEKGRKAVRELVVSPDGKNVVALNWIETKENDNSVHTGWGLELWNEDLQDQPFVLKAPTDSGKVSGMEFSPDGKTLACFDDADTKGKVELWDIASKTASTLDNAHILSVHSLVFSPDSSKMVVIGSSEDYGLTAEMWDARSRQLIMTLVKASGRNAPDAQGAPRQFKGPFAVGGGATLLATFSLDGRFLAISGNTKLGPSVELWDMEHLEPGGPLAWLGGLQSSISCMAFSADSKVLATGDIGGQVTLWSTASYRRLVTLYSEPAKQALDSIAFSPDNRIMITSTKDGSVRLWPTLPSGQ